MFSICGKYQVIKNSRISSKIRCMIKWKLDIVIHSSGVAMSNVNDGPVFFKFPVMLISYTNYFAQAIRSFLSCLFYVSDKISDTCYFKLTHIILITPIFFSL